MKFSLSKSVMIMIGKSRDTSMTESWLIGAKFMASETMIVMAHHSMPSTRTTGHVVITLLLSHPSCVSLAEHRRLLRRAPFTADKDEQSPGKLWVD